MMREISLTASLLVSVAVAGLLPAHAQDKPPTAAKPGAWVIARTSEWPDICTLRLLPGETIGGQELSLGKDCLKSFKWTGDLAAWRTSPGNLVLADATRKTVIAFRQVPDGDYVGTGPDKVDYVMSPVWPSRKK